MIEKQAFYRTLNQQAQALLEGEPDLIANLANLSALLNQELTDINWVGFYLLQGETLVLGPFQGKVACVRIPVGKGVCGSAVAERRSQLVTDVHAFPGHIACDSRSASEIVVPVLDSEGRLIAVFDVDATEPAAFDADDQVALERLMAKVFGRG